MRSTSSQNTGASRSGGDMKVFVRRNTAASAWIPPRTTRASSAYTSASGAGSRSSRRAEPTCAGSFTSSGTVSTAACCSAPKPYSTTGWPASSSAALASAVKSQACAAFWTRPTAASWAAPTRVFSPAAKHSAPPKSRFRSPMTRFVLETALSRPRTRRRAPARRGVSGVVRWRGRYGSGYTPRTRCAAPRSPPGGQPAAAVVRSAECADERPKRSRISATACRHGAAASPSPAALEGSGPREASRSRAGGEVSSPPTVPPQSV